MKNEEYFKQFIAEKMDFPIPGINFKDVIPTLENAEAYHHCIDAFEELAKQYDFNKIICADARGFLFGPTLGYLMNKGIVIARKPKKLPRPGLSYSYTLEYANNTLVISEGSLSPDDRVLVIDDLLATGGSALAMINLVKMSNATPIAALFYVELPNLHGKEAIQKEVDIPVHSLVKYEDL